MTIRVYLEKNVTPALIEEAVPLIRQMHVETQGAPLRGLNTNFLRDAVMSNLIRVIVARDGATLVGFMLMYTFESILGEKHATITDVYVDKPHRGKALNVADQMMALATAMADAGGAKCSAIARKEHAINMFLRNGFVATGVSLERAHG